MKKLFTKQYLIIIVTIILLSSKVSIANPIPVSEDIIYLNAGWNLISFDVIPFSGSEPWVVFAPLIYNNNLQIVTGFQNQTGVFFDPYGPPFLNTLQNLIPGEGYWVKVQNADVLSVGGVYIEYYPDFSNDLKTGWNLVGYWLWDTKSPESAFAPLMAAGVLQMVTGYEQGGKFFNPNGLPVLNTLTEIKNSFGYWVKVSEDINDFNYQPFEWQCGNFIYDERDGQSYETVQIGNQCWMKENLNIGNRIDSSSSPTNNGVVEKYCYDNLESNCDIYGGLYQWNEMMQYSTLEGIQAICPFGWHLPSDAEWCTITSYLDATVNCSAFGWSGTDACGKMKETDTLHWASPNTGATNSSGFTALPGGLIFLDEGFGRLNRNAYFWSTTTYPNNPPLPYYRRLDYNNAMIDRNCHEKINAFSVRCLKD